MTLADITPENDSDLIDRSRRGEAEAFTHLVFRHQGRVRAYLGRSLRRADAVDDLAQEVFLIALRSLGTFRGDSSFSVWLLGIARNKLLVYLRDEVRPRAAAGDVVEAALIRFCAEAVEAEHLDLARREREIEALERCLESLSGPSSSLISERYYRARGIDEIAREQGKREGAVRMMLVRVRQGLRSCVERRLAEEGSR